MFQAGIIKLCSKELDDDISIEQRLEKIENYLKSGKTSINLNSNIIPSTPKVVNNYAVPTQKKSITTERTTSNKQYSNDLNKSWPKIVNDLKQNGKIVLYTNLVNTRAEEINDMTVGIKFPNGLSAFGKTVLEKQENIKEISTLVSIACGKEMQIKYIPEAQNQVVQSNPEDDIQKLAKDSDIPFNIVE